MNEHPESESEPWCPLVQMSAAQGCEDTGECNKRCRDHRDGVKFNVVVHAPAIPLVMGIPLKHVTGPTVSRLVSVRSPRYFKPLDAEGPERLDDPRIYQTTPRLTAHDGETRLTERAPTCPLS